MDWSGKLVATLNSHDGMDSSLATQSGLSQSGQRIFVSTGGICDGSGDYPPLPPSTNAICPAYWTEINTTFRQGGRAYGYVNDNSTGAGQWIDETHLLARDSVLTVPQTVDIQTAIQRTRLPRSGICAGRYPGGL